jgi:hypothetical protein
VIHFLKKDIPEYLEQKYIAAILGKMSFVNEMPKNTSYPLECSRYVAQSFYITVVFCFDYIWFSLA